MPDGPHGSSLHALPFPAFAPRPPWIGGDLQTLRNTVLDHFGRRPSDPGGERLEFPAADGSGDVLVGTLSRPAGPARGRPLALLIHGLTGCQDSLYIRATATLLLERGYPVLRLNLRGAGPSRPSCRLRYHAGRSDDLRAVLAALPPALARHGIVAAGYSLGANLLLKYLGEEGGAAAFRAAVAVSAPIDLKAAQCAIMRPRNAVYHRYLLSRMREEALDQGSFPDPRDRELLRGIRTVYDFDDRVVAPRNGFGTAEVYYRESSALRHLGGIGVPTLVIHAADDPWIPAASYLAFDWDANPNLRLLLAPGGGHVGFHDRAGPPAWHDRCLLDLFNALGGGRDP